MKKIIVIIVGLIIISILPQVASQQISIGDPADQTLEISISENGDVHVIHHVDKSSSIQEVEYVSGKHSNLKITDTEGKEPQYAFVGDENESIALFPTINDVNVEYDLNDVLQHENGRWKWDFRYIATTTFIFPENLDLVFANKRPVKIDDAKGMRCHGCQALIEYVINEPSQRQLIQWEDKEFIIGISTLDEITSFNFNQSKRSLSFDVKEGNHFVTLTIPLKLLWNPYEVYLDDVKILKHEYFTNETHVFLNVEPRTPGTIVIIGTSTIPEFPILIPLSFGMAAVIILQLKNKINLR